FSPFRSPSLPKRWRSAVTGCLLPQDSAGACYCLKFPLNITGTAPPSSSRPAARQASPPTRGKLARRLKRSLRKCSGKKDNRGRLPVPGLGLLAEKLVVQQVKFHAIAGHHVLVGEDDHAGCRGIGHAQDHHLANRAPRQVAYVNHGTISLFEQLWIERRHFFLRVFGNRCAERERVNWILQVGFIRPHHAEIIADL